MSLFIVVISVVPVSGNLLSKRSLVLLVYTIIDNSKGNYILPVNLC